MKKVVKKMKQSLSILLAAAMVLTCVPQTALAAENDAIEAEVEAVEETVETVEAETETAEEAVDAEDAEEVSDTEVVTEEGGDSEAVVDEDADVEDVEEATPENADTGAEGKLTTLDFSNVAAGDIKSNTVLRDTVADKESIYTAIADSTNSMAVDENSKTFNITATGKQVKATKRLKTSGTGGTDKRAIYFKATSTGKLYVGAANAGYKDNDATTHTERNLILENVTVAGKQDGKMLNYGVLTYDVVVDNEYYLYSESSGMNIYYIELASGGSNTGTTTDKLATLDFSNVAAGDIKSNTVLRDTVADKETIYTAIADSTNSMAVDENSKTFNITDTGKQVKATKRLKTSGTGGTDKRAIYFKATATGKLYVGAANAGYKDNDATTHTERNLILENVTVAGKQDGKMLNYGVLTYNVVVDNEYYLYSESSGMNIYYIELASSTSTTPGAGGEPTNPNPPAAEDPTLTVNITSLDKGTITAEKNNLKLGESIFYVVPKTINNSDTNEVEIDVETDSKTNADKTLEVSGLTLSYRLKLAGVGSPQNRAIQFTADKKGTLTMYAASSNGKVTRNITLSDGTTGKVVGTAGNATEDGLAACKPIEIEKAGTYYIYSEDGGLNIYYLSLKYDETSQGGGEIPGQTTPTGDLSVTLEKSSVTYNRTEQKPVITSVKIGNDNVTDYKVSYTTKDGATVTKLTDAGEYKILVEAEVTTGDSTVTKTGSADYTIAPFSLNNADDSVVKIMVDNNSVKVAAKVEGGNLKVLTLGTDYTLKYAFNGQEVSVEDSAAARNFDIKTAAGVGTEVTVTATGKKNYIDSKNKTFTVTEGTSGNDDENLTDADANDDEPEQATYTVTFVFNKHTWPNSYAIGSSIKESDVEDLVDEGYVYAGLYKDSIYSAKAKWNFDKDIVDKNMFLYIAASPKDENALHVNPIVDQIYTGSQIKPVVTVYDNAGNLLKSGKDYTVKYDKNIEANVDENGDFIAGPTVTITGKGNYSKDSNDSLTVPFNIRPVSIGDDDTFAKGFTVKLNQTLIYSAKGVSPLTSIKYKKALKGGTDFTVSVYHKDAPNDGWGDATTVEGFPKLTAKGYYKLEIQGIKNYCDTVTKEVVVSDKENSIGKASVSVKGYNKLAYDDIDIVNGKLKLVKEENADYSTKISVKAANKAKTELAYDTDYTYQIIFANGSTEEKAVGKAQLVINAVEKVSPSEDEIAYYGSKIVNITITGTPAKDHLDWNWKDGFSDTTEVYYNGYAKTVDEYFEIVPVGSDTALVPKKQYTVSYKNNFKKGKATVTVTPTSSSGYTGKLTKTFTIKPADVNKIENVVLTDDTEDLEIKEGSIQIKDGVKAPYSKAGAKLTNFGLQNAVKGSGDKKLVLGTDYTVSYSGNKSIDKKGTITIKGKGNYTGSIKLTYDIKALSLKQLYDEAILAKAKEETPQLTWTATSVAVKSNAKSFKVNLKLFENNKALNKNDCTIEPETESCDIANVKAWVAGTSNIQPRAKVTGIKAYGGDGETEESFYIELNAYDPTNAKLTQNDVDWAPNNDYTFKPEGIQPAVEVYIPGSAHTIENLLEEGKDYIVTYGKNNAQGKKKCTAKIDGIGIYGGSVTIKNDIAAQPLNYKGTSGTGATKADYTKFIDEQITDYINIYRDRVVSKVNAIDGISDYVNNTVTVTISESGKSQKVQDVVNELEGYKTDERLDAHRQSLQNQIKAKFGEDIANMSAIDISVKTTTASGVKVEYPKTIKNPSRYLSDTNTSGLVDKIMAEYDKIMTESEYADRTLSSLIGKDITLSVTFKYSTSKSPITLNYTLKFN